MIKIEVLVKSKQSGIIATRVVPNFKYYFGDEPVKMPEKHAKYLLSNPNFSIVSKVDKQEIEVPHLENMNIKQLRAFAKKKGLKSKDTDTNELRAEILKEIEGGN